MQKTPRVSIITPSYNQADFLEQTICSVLQQDYPSVEYIIVDGASTDNSIEIIDRCSDHLAWWVSEPDAGQAEAINKGFERASGEIVAWLNSDDLYLPGAISQAVAALSHNHALGMVYGDAITIDSHGKPINKLSFGEWGLAEFLRFHIICQPAVFIRRTALESAGLLDPSYHFMLDHHLWIRIAQQAPVMHIPALWAAARHHLTAKNVAQPEPFGHEVMDILEWMQRQPGLKPLITRDYKRVSGGAYRLNARYLLDGGKYKTALQFYWRALLAWPGFTLKHWHRMVYAILCLIGAQKPMDQVRSTSSTRQRTKLASKLRQYTPMGTSIDSCHTSLANWPGLDLKP